MVASFLADQTTGWRWSIAGWLRVTTEHGKVKKKGGRVRGKEEIKIMERSGTVDV